MDPLTHVILTRKLVGKGPSITLAGLGPDLPFYLTYPAWLATRREARKALTSRVWPDPQSWMLALHRFSHSLAVLSLAGVALRLWTGRWPVRHLAAWGLHIVVDIPSHSQDPWGPRFLWPLSGVAVDGVPWTDIPTRLLSWAGRR